MARRARRAYCAWRRPLAAERSRLHECDVSATATAYPHLGRELERDCDLACYMNATATAHLGRELERGGGEILADAIGVHALR